MIRAEAIKFAKYVVAGLLATGTHYVVMIVLVNRFALPEVVSSSLGFIAGALVKYPLNYYGVFDSDAEHRGAVVRFVLSLVISFVINAAVFAVLLRMLDVHYMVSQVLTTGLVLFVNYLLARYWVFSGRAAKEPV